jgi:RNA polymerase sigma-70 factor (ECF subfamily)
MTTAALTAKKKITDADSELVAAIAAGATERFAEIVERYARRIYSFSRRMCRDEAEAEDLVQETFLNAFRYLGEFRYETKFRNWLYRIAASTCIRRMRRSRFAPERELSLEEIEPGAEAAFDGGVPAWARAPLDQLLDEELFDRLNRAIRELPEKYRLAVVLRDIEGFDTEEAAQIMGISPANLKVRLHRARMFLKEKLKGYFEHGV